jgi:hypothetical protein
MDKTHWVTRAGIEARESTKRAVDRRIVLGMTAAGLAGSHLAWFGAQREWKRCRIQYGNSWRVNGPNRTCLDWAGWRRQKRSRRLRWCSPPMITRIEREPSW